MRKSKSKTALAFRPYFPTARYVVITQPIFIKLAMAHIVMPATAMRVLLSGATKTTIFVFCTCSINHMMGSIVVKNLKDMLPAVVL